MTTGDPSSGEGNTPPTVVTPPAQTQSQPAPQVDLQPLLTQLQALPELISKSVKEAVGQPKAQTPAAPKAETVTTEVKKTEETKSPVVATGGTPGKKSFIDWWFG